MKKFKKLIIFSIMFILCLSLACISNAENVISNSVMQNEENDRTIPNNSPLNDINADLDTLSQNVLSSKTNYFNASNDPIHLDSDVEGDAFILCRQKVTIDSYVSGNVFVCSTNVEITENAEISGSLFCVTQNLNLSGEISGNAYCVSQNFNFNKNSSIGLTLYLTGEDIALDGAIENDANIAGNKITVLENFSVNGDLNYSASEEVQIPESAIISGNIRYSINSNEDENVSMSDTIKSFIRSALSYIILTIVLFLILYKIDIKFVKNDIKIKENLGKFILCGFLTSLLTPILCVITLFTGFTFALSFILLIIYIALLLVSSSITIIVLSRLLSDKFKESFIKNNNVLRNSIFIAILCIAYKLLKLVPIIGTITTLAFNVIGIGILTKNIFFKTKSESVEK